MDRRSTLTALWTFLTVNFIFCDVFSLHYHKNLQNLLTGKVDGTGITQEFLLAFSIIMEIPMLMILLSGILKPKLNRGLSLTFGMLLALVQTATLLGGDNTLHYWFFSAVELITCFCIVWIARTWNIRVRNEKAQ